MPWPDVHLPNGWHLRGKGSCTGHTGLRAAESAAVGHHFRTTSTIRLLLRSPPTGTRGSTTSTPSATARASHVRMLQRHRTHAPAPEPPLGPMVKEEPEDDELKHALMAFELAELTLWPDLPLALNALAMEATAPEPWSLHGLVGQTWK